MRVLHITPYYAPAYVYGGPVLSREQLVKELSRLGIEQRIITTNANGNRVLDSERGWNSRDGVPTIYLPLWKSPYIAPSVLPVAFDSCRWADLVHISGVFYVPSVLGLLAARLASKPTVLSTHGALQPVAMQTVHGRKRAWLRMFGRLYDGVAIFHATASHEAHAVRDAFGPNCRITTIPNGTESLTDTEVVGLCEESPYDPTAIGMMGRLHPIKALDRVLDAMAILRRAGIVTKLRFAGPVEDPDYRDALMKQAERLGLSSHFELLGPLYGWDKLRFYAHCAVLVVASHSENFGNVVVEALNVRTPVVASKGTPWTELAEHRCGAWVDNQPESLAAAIAPFIMSPDLRRCAGDAGRQLVQRKYTWPTIARQMLKVYDTEIHWHHDAVWAMQDTSSTLPVTNSPDHVNDKYPH
jgi:glycosyltransferase involved in cell wall biosynthesis